MDLCLVDGRCAPGCTNVDATPAPNFGRKKGHHGDRPESCRDPAITPCYRLTSEVLVAPGYGVLGAVAVDPPHGFPGGCLFCLLSQGPHYETLPWTSSLHFGKAHTPAVVAG